MEIDDLNQIEHEIKRIQDVIITANSLPIVDIPIYLTIYRENQFDLTMIDLPGMTYFDPSIKDKNGMKINKMIKQMWKRYISNKNAVILITI